MQQIFNSLRCKVSGKNPDWVQVCAGTTDAQIKPINTVFLLLHVSKLPVKQQQILLSADWLLPVLEVDDMSSLQAHLQEIAQFYVL